MFNNENSNGVSEPCVSIDYTRIDQMNKEMKFIYPVNLNLMITFLCTLLTTILLCITLDKHCSEHVSKSIKVCTKLIVTIKHLSKYLHWSSLLTIYVCYWSSFTVFYTIFQVNTWKNFNIKLTLPAQVQFKEICRKSLYHECGLESHSTRCWFGKLVFFYKIVNCQNIHLICWNKIILHWSIFTLFKTHWIKNINSSI